jgi:putative surface protein
LKGLPFLHIKPKIINISSEEKTMENAQKNPQAMQEALLETLNRLARINEVEGFDPRLLVACYKNESGEENLYLPAEPAMLWFRLKYPHGRLEQVATRVTQPLRAGCSTKTAQCLQTRL